MLNKITIYVISVNPISPVALRYLVHPWLETVRVIALVTSVAQQQLILILARMAKLTILQ